MSPIRSIFGIAVFSLLPIALTAQEEVNDSLTFEIEGKKIDCSNLQSANLVINFSEVFNPSRDYKIHAAALNDYFFIYFSDSASIAVSMHTRDRDWRDSAIWKSLSLIPQSLIHSDDVELRALKNDSTSTYQLIFPIDGKREKYIKLEASEGEELRLLQVYLFLKEYWP